jgi:hypothetical protein
VLDNDGFRTPLIWHRHQLQQAVRDGLFVHPQQCFWLSTQTMGNYQRRSRFHRQAPEVRALKRRVNARRTQQRQQARVEKSTTCASRGRWPVQ